MKNLLLESLAHLAEQAGYPWEPLFDEGPEHWLPLGSASNGTAAMLTEHSLAELREQSRILVQTNEFAINALENRINFVIGNGHKYHVIACDPNNAELASKAQGMIEEFVNKSHWHRRQQEIMRRRDRDGEVFLRFFIGKRGDTLIRFVEPDQVQTPPELSDKPNCRLGIRTSPHDVEQIEGYWIDGQFVPDAHIQHRKSNVDFNVKRGIPLLTPVRKNLRRAEKLLRNMSVVAEIQSAIALIRKHNSPSGDSIRRYVQNQSKPTGATENVQQFSPGTIIDAHQGIDYHFPVAAIDAGRYVEVLQAELRAIASRLVMPEFMLSSDASNSNYASTMIAEGPAVRMFERLQFEMIEDDLRVMRRVIRNKAGGGFLPYDVLSKIQIQAVPPMLAVRDRLDEAKADEILLNHGIISPQTFAMRYGLDPIREQSLMACCDIDASE